MQTTKVQASLRMRAFLSEPMMFAMRIAFFRDAVHIIRWTSLFLHQLIQIPLFYYMKGNMESFFLVFFYFFFIIFIIAFKTQKHSEIIYKTVLFIKQPIKIDGA